MIKSIFKPFIGEVKEPLIEPSDRLLTPANAMTVSRPLLALFAAHLLLQPERSRIPVTPIVVGMAATDMEGKVARWFDKHRPEWEIGTSKIGTEGDQIADTAAILIVGAAALRAPRVSLPGKLAIVTALGQEGVKTGWALKSQFEYGLEHGGKLEIPTLPDGKAAMAEKLTGVVLGVATNDFESFRVRVALGAGAVGFAGLGAMRGEHVRQEYEATFEDMMTGVEFDVPDLAELVGQQEE